MRTTVTEFVDQSSQRWSAPDLRSALCGLGVVVGAMPGKDGAQVPLTEDQDPFGEFGPDRQHEPFCEAVRSRLSRWDLDGSDTRASQNGVERGGPFLVGQIMAMQHQNDLPHPVLKIRGTRSG